MDGVRICRRCEAEKPVAEFRDQRRACRPCERAEKNAARAKLDREPVVGVLKTCSKCEEEKPSEEFSTDRRSVDGRHAWCNPCARTKAGIRRAGNPELQRAATRRYKAKDPERAKAEYRRYDIGRRFGMTSEEYDQQRSAVEMCGVCGTTEPGHLGWVLDHCHSSGGVREFLCCTCNLVLGLFKDDPDRFISAAAYLIKHSGIGTEDMPGMAEKIEERQW